MNTDRVYLDHAATSPLRPEAREALIEGLGQTGNASSVHASGRRARTILEDAREDLAELLGCDPVEVIFTSGGTEADNLAVQGVWQARPRGRIGLRQRLICSAVEHPAVLETMGALRADGADVVLAPVPGGVLDLDALTALLDVATQLVSVMWVNNETGSRQPIRDIAEAARAAEAWVHCDAVQALGTASVDFAATGLDLMSVTAHKVGGPVGVGALVARRELPLRAYAFGGGQERDLRSGTHAPALAAAFAAAMRAAAVDREQESQRLTSLRGRLIDGLVGLGQVNEDGGEHAPHIVNVWFPGCLAGDLLLLLDEAGIDCSTGSACSAGVTRPSEVLLAMGLDERAAQSLRFSMGWSSTAADIDRLLAMLPEAIDRAKMANEGGER